MDELKLKASEKLEALQVAAKTAAGNGSSKVHNVYNQTAEAIRKVCIDINKIRHALQEIWHHELIIESRQRVSAWTHDTLRRIREGAPPLSPVLLYEELVALFKDRVWRRSMVVFCAGCVCGVSAGLLIGLRWSLRVPSGPHCRALHSHCDGSVLLVEDAVAPGAGAGEVLVRVQAFSVCAVDRAVLRGHGAVLRALLTRTPVTVGRGFAGIVLDAGAGVTLELGDEVWGCLSEWSSGAGTELLVITSSRVWRRPRGLAADAAASLPWGGAAALTALDRLNYNAHNAQHKRVCVVGAGSGEGCALVQLLSSWGAHVTVTAPPHHHRALQELGASECINLEAPNSTPNHVCSWSALEQYGAKAGPWDSVVACAGLGAPPDSPAYAAVLRSTASRNCIVDLRPRALISDRLPGPFSLMFAAGFYTYRTLRWMCRRGWHTEWLEDRHRVAEGLATLTELVHSGQLTPLLDKVYLPQDFESALAHACSEDAIGTTVIRFP